MIPSLSWVRERETREARRRGEWAWQEPWWILLSHCPQAGPPPSGAASVLRCPREVSAGIPDPCICVHPAHRARHWFLTNETLLSSGSSLCDQRSHCWGGLRWPSCSRVSQSLNLGQSNSCSSFGFAYIFPSPLHLVLAPVFSFLPGCCNRLLANSPSSATLWTRWSFWTQNWPCHWPLSKPMDPWHFIPSLHYLDQPAFPSIPLFSSIHHQQCLITYISPVMPGSL